MQCPNGCQEGVEREDSIIIEGVKEIPMAEYLCLGCDWNAEWVRGRGLKILFEGVAARVNPFQRIGFHLEFVSHREFATECESYYVPDDEEGAIFQQACWGNE